MKKSKDLTIKKYWIETPERFSEQYINKFYFLISPTNIFLRSRRRKVLDLLNDVHGKKVLDVGCGSGILMIDLIKKGAYVVGVDYSKKMISIAQKELKYAKISKSRYQLLKADARNLSFKNQSFDIILATGLTDYLPGKGNEKFMREASRVLKKEGKLIISFPVEKSPVSFLRFGAGLWLRKTILKLPPIANKFSLSDIRSLLNKNGLIDVQHLKVFYTMWIIVAKHKN